MDNGEASFAGQEESWSPAKYLDFDAPIRLASWQEAQFIIAEIQGGSAARDIINLLRVENGITEVYDPGGTATDTEIRDKVIDERERTLYLEGQRMGDLRRYLEKFGMDLFPVLPNSGDQTCMPLPDLERQNNPDLP